MVQLVKTPLGFFVVALKDQVVEFKELEGTPEETAIIIDELYDVWEEHMREKAYDVETPERTLDPIKVVELIGIPEEQFLKASREVGLVFSKIRIKEAIGRDHLIAQTIGALDDLTKAINLLANRAMEWYGIHYPEYKESDMEKYIKGLLKHQRGRSMGLEISDIDLNAIRDYADGIVALMKRKDSLEAYLDRLMEEVAPNTRAIAGSNLGARLIARAGSLGEMAKLPASTIQVLGAEKALFKHLQKKGVPPPKHGIIFQHPEVSGAVKSIRGRIARSLATKISIAARVDFFSGDFRQHLVDDWNERLKEVKKDAKN